jgi:5-methylcytosine-specific restriction endonuclease McrA
MPHCKNCWIRLHKRMAIYYRDSFDCVYCRCIFPIDETGHGLTLDHLDSEGGNNASNLVTCCPSCNATRGKRSLAEWYTILESRGIPARTIRARIKRLTARPLNLYAGRMYARLRCPNYPKYGYK